MSEVNIVEEYISHLCSKIQQQGLRDVWLISDKLKERNSNDDCDVIVLHVEKVRSACQVYYGLKSNPSAIGRYDFKLKSNPKSESVCALLKLKEWESVFSSTIRDEQYTLNDLRLDVADWVEKLKNVHLKSHNHFFETLKVYLHYTGQPIVSFREQNGELKKIKPIIRKHKGVTLDELYEFGKEKSLEFWNRDFTCKITLVKTYWKDQLGVYYPDRETIAFSEHMNATQSKKKVLDTMLHEMVHWHLHTSGKEYDDEDFGFIEECLRVGCGLSQSSSARRAYVMYKSKT
ncbi:hypothetical protein EBB07_28995 [Paenibacillaceae bacterium]|nr:hypothetical protein EBB07_28995 [Paenibacillaceae bacterium]